MPPKERNVAVARAANERFRVRRYCFTLHVPDATTPFSGVADDQKHKVRFLIAQLEQCPTTQRYHWQGYVEFLSPIDLNSAKRLLQSHTIHMDVCNGTREHNIAYCTKEESRVPGVERYTLGEVPSADEPPKKKSQMDLVMEKIQIGAKFEQITDEHPGIALNHREKILTAISDVLAVKIGYRRSVYVEVRWGHHGTGKTTSVHHPAGVATCNKFNPPLGCWSPSKVFVKRFSMGNWFDGYRSQPVLVLDDIQFVTPEHAHFLLEVLDQPVTNMQIKGGSTLAAWRHVVITSNIDPKEWFIDPKNGTLTINQQTYDAVMDRINRIEKFEGPSFRNQADNVPLPYEESDDEGPVNLPGGEEEDDVGEDVGDGESTVQYNSDDEV